MDRSARPSPARAHGRLPGLDLRSGGFARPPRGGPHRRSASLTEKNLPAEDGGAHFPHSLRAEARRSRTDGHESLEFIPPETYAVPTEALRHLLALIAAQAGQRTERSAS